MLNWAGKIKIIYVLLLLAVRPLTAVAEDGLIDLHIEESRNWYQFQRLTLEQENRDRTAGLSYIFSGVIAVAGGFAGQGITSDPLEKGVYAIFQTLGIASIGYGAYVWRVGTDDRMMYDTLRTTPGLSDYAKTAVVQSYYRERKERERRERIVRAVTHGLIAGLNFYSATQQTPGPVRTGLYFIGGVNVLACASFSF